MTIAPKVEEAGFRPASRTFAGWAGPIGKTFAGGKTIATDFTDYLLKEAHVAVRPGSAFGLSGTALTRLLGCSFNTDAPTCVTVSERI